MSHLVWTDETLHMVYDVSRGYVIRFVNIQQSKQITHTPILAYRAGPLRFVIRIVNTLARTWRAPDGILGACLIVRDPV